MYCVIFGDVLFLILPNDRLALNMFRLCTQNANYSTRILTVTHTHLTKHSVVLAFYMNYSSDSQSYNHNEDPYSHQLQSTEMSLSEEIFRKKIS